MTPDAGQAMLEVPVFNQAGSQVETLKVDPAKLGGEVHKELLKQALVMYHANQRQGTVRTKSRGEVAGSTRKIYRQKGTGNARMGTIRQPVRRGGGHAKQKLPKDWRQTLPKQARRLATKSAILAKIQAGDLKLVNEIRLEGIKTKPVAAMFKALGIDRSVLLAIDGNDPVLRKSARNIDRTTVTSVQQLNAWDILRRRTLLMTKGGFEKVIA
ncbi:MAG: 50S ribosomal protein L4 [Phycisphaerae bacterium]|nr:50S ribosomal protein L4 [Phycisphaerae bacterium]MDW8262400.1 50S ribosomal protein L4 [Phycisphaerales bacterium]